MALNKASYYTGEGPEIPAAGNDYGAPTPHAAVANQHPFEAPNTNPDGTYGGVGSVTPNDDMFGDPATPASYQPTTGDASDTASPAQDAANTSFNAGGIHDNQSWPGT